MIQTYDEDNGAPQGVGIGTYGVTIGSKDKSGKDIYYYVVEENGVYLFVGPDGESGRFRRCLERHRCPRLA